MNVDPVAARAKRPPPHRRPGRVVSRLVGVLALGAAAAGGWMVAGQGQSGKPQAAASRAPKSKVSAAAAKSNALPEHISWDQKNPLESILKKYTGGARIEAIAKLVEQTPVSELGHLLDLAAMCPQSEIRQLVADLVYAKWVASDPPGALAYANAAATQSGHKDALDSLFSAWAGLDPPAAFAAAQSLSRPAFRNAEIALVLSNWVQSGDASAALAAWKALGSGKISPMAQDPFRQNSGPVSPDFFDAWSKVDPAAAWAALDQIDSPTARNAAMNVILGNMAASDPQGALRLLISTPSGKFNNSTYNQVFQEWAEQDPNAAFAALSQLPAGDARTHATESVFEAWAESDPAAALQAAQSLPPRYGLAAVINSPEYYSVKGLASTDPQSATDFIDSLPAGSADRANLAEHLADDWSDSDPASALAWLNQNVTGMAYDEALTTVLNQLSKTDPNAALAYIVQLPADSNRDDYLKTAMSNWGYHDSTTAAAWANANLSGSAQEVALAGVADALTSINPAAAADLLGQLPDSSIRDNALALLASQWARVNSDAATQWLQNLPADLPAANLRTITQNVNQVIRSNN